MSVLVNCSASPSVRSAVRSVRGCSKRTPPSDSGSEAAIETPSPSPSVGPLPIVAASRHWSLHTPTDGDGDEAVKQRQATAPRFLPASREQKTLECRLLP
jgi:hypothetical protein